MHAISKFGAMSAMMLRETAFFPAHDEAAAGPTKGNPMAAAPSISQGLYVGRKYVHGRPHYVVESEEKLAQQGYAVICAVAI
jgi:hypothetical protein